VDILAADREGNLLVIEVKRGQTPRDVVAQALEYASDVGTWDYPLLNRRAAQYFASRGMEYESLLAAFQAVFSVDPVEFHEQQFNQEQRIFVVAEAIDPKTERTARWLRIASEETASPAGSTGTRTHRLRAGHDGW
jgi:hypothetical protein